MSVTNFLLKTLRELDRVFVCFGSQYSASVRRASLGIDHRHCTCLNNLFMYTDIQYTVYSQYCIQILCSYVTAPM